jgi:Nucleotidyl transferase AbiEii toxin, Type IV TA system
MSGGDTTSYRERLTPLQADFLSSFFVRTQNFFLTGGAALIGFYGMARLTNDLDLFTLEEDAFAHSDGSVTTVAKELGAEISVLRAYPHFRRYHLKRGRETLELDLVCEFAPQLIGQKSLQEGILIDPLDEIAANKVCALVGRSEVRDLWDLHQLTLIGYDLDTLIDQAGHKDGGVDSESVLYVLSGLNWDALQRAADRVKISDFEAVRKFFRRETERLALKLLPNRGR